MNAFQESLKEDYLIRLEYLKHLVNLMNDIILSAWKNCGAGTKRMYPYRQLCIGTLIVARNNAEATIHLVDAELIHQVHYISRSMLELTINLYYILDDEAERDARLERYRRYSDEVLPFKVLQVARKYPDRFKSQITEEQAEVKEKRCKGFLARYKRSSGKDPSEESWSDMKMPDMIKKIINEEDRKELQTLYDFIVKLNNWYLHPSWYYLKSATADLVNPNRDHQESIAQMTMIFTAGEKIVMKSLANFPRGRPEFQARLTEIGGWFRSEKNPLGI